MLREQLPRSAITSVIGFEQIFRLMSEVLQIRTGGEYAGHDYLLSHAWGPHAGRKKVHIGLRKQWAQPFPWTGRACIAFITKYSASRSANAPVCGRRQNNDSVFTDPAV